MRSTKALVLLIGWTLLLVVLVGSLHLKGDVDADISLPFLKFSLKAKEKAQTPQGGHSAVHDPGVTPTRDR